MNLIAKILTGLATVMLFMVGSDKFLKFLQPPCSLEASIPTPIWSLFGVLMIASGILIWLPKFRRPVLIFFCLFMLTFTIIHLINGQSDIGGSLFMGVLLGLLVWNPKFLRT